MSTIISAPIFEAEPDFCASCGSILALPIGSSTDDNCTVCGAVVDREGSAEVTYVIHFNDPDVYSKEKKHTSKKKHKKKGKGKLEAEGPIVDRECRECGHNQMSYATLQLRSADEGQTVFYTCTKCKFKESENS